LKNWSLRRGSRNRRFDCSDFLSLEISALIGPVHAFENAARPAVFINSSRKRSCSKTLFKTEEFEKGRFSFSYGKKTS